MVARAMSVRGKRTFVLSTSVPHSGFAISYRSRGHSLRLIAATIFTVIRKIVARLPIGVVLLNPCLRLPQF